MALAKGVDFPARKSTRHGLIARDGPMGINFFTGQFTTYYQYMMAAATMAMLPMIVVYLFAQRYFVAGISLSGIKA